jgi:hypothetical protein
LAFIKERWKIVTERKSGKRILGSMTDGKRECIFSARGVVKMCGCRATEKRKIEETYQKLGCQLLLSKEIILGHPCVPRVGLTRATIRTEA